MTNFEIPVSLRQLISSNQAFHYRIVPLEQNGDAVTFRTDSQDDQLIKELSIVLKYAITLKQETTANIDAYLTTNYRKLSANQELSDGDFLKQLLQTAKDFNSSDIHIEPYEFSCRVRFRLDGKLKEYYTIPLQDYPQLINRIKNEAGLDISEKRLSQDGRITVTDVLEDFDIRVSTLPTLYGEKIVLRILKRDADHVDLKSLGFTETELKTYLEGIKKPNGIILISGPTGSGKTTTLYGTLKLLNKEETNVVTIEDPIEYKLDGINQVQLKEDIGFDFPKALRTFLRQDPDIIMVGEIRDEKTANMAIKAALTGHLVLSTIHTNSAWATISRLIDMGVPSFLVANTLHLSVAQRLVRILCNDCKQEAVIKHNTFPESFTNDSKIETHYIPKGCGTCHFTGYKGRKALYEIIPVTQEVKEFINQNRLQIDTYIATHSIKTLKSNAIEMIENGNTSVEEVYSLLAD